MSEQKVMNRWLVVAGAILIQLALGAIYAWSVFTPELKGAGWTALQTQAVFSTGLAFFAIVMVSAGFMLPKLGPRKLAIAGGLVLGTGYALAGLFAGTGFWPIFLLIGVLGGSGIGLAYVIPIAVGMRWFPDKKGLITGLAVAGFGFGAMLWVKLAGAWGHLIAEVGLPTTFLIYGIMFAAMVVIGGIWMVFPPDGWKPKGWNPAPIAGSGQAAAAGSINFTTRQMLRTPQFYMILMTFVFGASAGLMSIGLMKLFPMQALQATGMSVEAASAIAGTAMAVFFSLANGIGRIAWGAMSDSLGRKKSIIIMMTTQGIAVILFQWMASSEYLLYAAATVIGFNFGGNFALFPTMTADTFGTKHVGQNYPFIFLAYGIGGIGGPMLGGRLGDLGNFPMAFTICGVLCLAAAVIIAQVKPATESQKMSIGNSGVKPPFSSSGKPPAAPSGGRPIAPA
ncbi:MAG: OFA family MFS transporter [Planctomycetes bacterium]|jgi:OFA family oxalate/formate antiporter-like MFS transporter|nr:OFA family MFS transporter [Planctomycetota bacterium]MBT4028898.1 OFA family MFS transporter [Planctomycetota bacterium]MBT4561270.1 OFA family MFS transporter [Planctomycetota bacterium]MBT5101618.1 OFA family MFS transporter [Planctomycetota bacterium]MBT5119200.1 OFA family MFS transporter [Planctomycetota bacterium]